MDADHETFCILKTPFSWLYLSNCIILVIKKISGKCQIKATFYFRSRSTSEEEVSSAARRRSLRMSRRGSEASIPELSRRLFEACGARMNNAIKRLIFDLTQKFLRNSDGNQDLHVFMVILLVLIAGLILLGYGEERTVVHLHHWEYFNPPKDL